MVPTKAKDLIPEVANTLSIPEEHLQNIVSFFYKENKQLLVGLEHMHLKFRGLGTMHIKGWLLDRYIEDYEEKLTVYSSPEILEDIRSRRDLYIKAKEKWSSEKKKKREAGVLKKQYYDNKLTKENDTERENTGSLE